MFVSLFVCEYTCVVGTCMFSVCFSVFICFVAGLCVCVVVRVYIFFLFVCSCMIVFVCLFVCLRVC